MAAVIPNKKRIRPFASTKLLETWMRTHHDKEPELWLKIHKKGSGLPSVTAAEALDVMLCWGWIDGLRKGFDEKSFLQRYTPRRSKSIWSQVNREHVARLIKAGRMTPHGQAQIDAAKKDGRWGAAYAPIRATSADKLPPDLLKAIRANPRIVATGFVDDVAPYYHVMNVLAHPSRREGLPNAVLEAQAAGLPVAATRATGVVDAIVNGTTGRLTPLGDVNELAEAILASSAEGSFFAGAAGAGSFESTTGTRFMLALLISSWAMTQPRLRIVMWALTFSTRLVTNGLMAVSYELLTPLNMFST